MNRVLRRQLRRLGLTASEPPADAAAWSAFLERVGASYDDADRSRYVLERSMDISSREMAELNAEIVALSERAIHRQDQFARHNFNELPVAAWLESFQRVVDRLEDLRGDGVSDLAAYLEERPEALVDLIGRVEVIDCNPAVSALVGADRETLLGPVDASRVGIDSLISWQRQFEAIWDGVGRVEVEFAGQRFDGSGFSAILQWSAAEIDGALDYSRVMVVVIDITERIAVEEKMRRLIVSKDEFLASVSHELRTPLTSVLGYARVLCDEGIDPDERRAMVATIADQAHDLSNIVEDLLAGARGDRGQLDVRPTPFEVGDLVERSTAAFPEVEIVRMGGDGPVAVGDPARVRQILRNLLTNAARYGGREVAVRIAETDGGAIEIAVGDSGPPLEPEVAEQVFERYYRQRGELGRPGSVGLGLTISRELARQMGGDITYRHDGQWSEFVLTLPRHEPRLRAVG